MVSSDIADWRPDGFGEHQLVNVNTWRNIAYNWPNGVLPEHLDCYWYLYWMQSMPGWGNQIPYNARSMTNWWQFTGDWDTANRANLGLYDVPGTYQIAPASDVFAPEGGVATVNVSGALCGWMASSNATWVHITSTPYGSGSGTVQLQVDANPGAQREATVAIANNLYKLTQLAPGGPSLGIVKSHSGDFFQGQLGATYSIVVGNASGAAATSGAVTVTDSLPAGLTLVSMGGEGWTCDANSCSRGGPLAGGVDYPAIVVRANVGQTAASPLVNVASVRGGGSGSAIGSDSTVIKVFSCDIGGDGPVTATDVALEVGELLVPQSAAHDLNRDNVVNVLDVQKVINAASGFACSY